MNLSYEIVLAILVGVLCLSVIILLCLKTSQKNCSEGAYSNSRNKEGANIKLASDAPAEETKKDSSSEVQVSPKDVNECDGDAGNNLTKTENEQPYAEINLECPADVTYSTIQEAMCAKAPGTSENRPIEGDYSTIETPYKAGLDLGENPHSSPDGAVTSPIAPVPPKPREIKCHQETTDNPLPDGSAFAHLYSKVMKQNKVVKNYSLNDLDDIKVSRCEVNETNVNSRNSIIGITMDLEKIKRPVDNLYSQVNKVRKTIAVPEKSGPADNLAHDKSIKSTSGEGHIYSCIEDQVNKEMTEKIVLKPEESPFYEEINISP